MAQNCEEAVYSEEYEDYIIEYFGEGREVEEFYQTSCYQLLTNRLGIIYQRADEVDVEQQNQLLILPRCFGLLSSTQVLESAGVAQVQRVPGLSLYGQGVMLGIVDTGAGVRMAAR